MPYLLISTGRAAGAEAAGAVFCSSVAEEEVAGCEVESEVVGVAVGSAVAAEAMVGEW